MPENDSEILHAFFSLSKQQNRDQILPTQDGILPAKYPTRTSWPSFLRVGPSFWSLQTWSSASLRGPCLRTTWRSRLRLQVRNRGWCEDPGMVGLAPQSMAISMGKVEWNGVPYFKSWFMKFNKQLRKPKYLLEPWHWQVSSFIWGVHEFKSFKSFKSFRS